VQSAPRGPGSAQPLSTRRLPIGAELLAAGGVHFRVWAPGAARVDVALEGGSQAWPLAAEDGGYFSGAVAAARCGTLYRLRLDGGEAFPDPASRFQPGGPHGPSEVVDPAAFAWTDHGWPGVQRKGQVLYELHVGTFTPQGTYAAAQEHLPFLKDLGVTIIELMPVNEFNGPFGWGYDGVDLFAPTRLYGRPDDLRTLVDRAHATGLGVILDVVYNHFGPSGNYLAHFSRDYVTDRYVGEWGEPVNFDGEGCAAVREFVIANAGYWIDEFHLDGLRLDAIQSIHDASEKHVVTEIVERARAAAGTRSIYLSGENEPQRASLVRSAAQGGCELDALWNDDLHHSLTAAATGLSDAYYSETRGTPQELISGIKWGYLYQGQYYAWQNKRRGTPALDLPAEVFINFVQNHDQVANSARGKRLHQATSPGRLRALTALLLLAPGTPLLFQGQEFAASAPFVYFARHEDDLTGLVREGRGEFLAQFPNIGSPRGRALLADPGDASSFEQCKLDHGERETNAHVVRLHRDLLRLRREDPVFAAQDASRLHGAVLGPEAFLLRYLGDAGDDRLLVVNLGASLPLLPAPEPLLAPPQGKRWRLLWNSEDPEYGGDGMAEPDTETSWRLPPHALAVLAPSDWKEQAE
jgi:maltooligosyltrehalose trehalohydrolase